MVAADAIGAVEGIGGEKVASSIKAASGIAMDAGGKVGRARANPNPNTNPNPHPNPHPHPGRCSPIASDGQRSPRPAGDTSRAAQPGPPESGPGDNSPGGQEAPWIE